MCRMRAIPPLTMRGVEQPVLETLCKENPCQQPCTCYYDAVDKKGEKKSEKEEEKRIAD